MARTAAIRGWDQRELIELLPLEHSGPASWRSTVCDINANGRVYGGQLLGQALWAAAQTAQGRSPSMMQMTFLQGTRPDDAIEYSVESLQEGRRFSTRHVYGVQGTGLVLSANASFQAAQAQDLPPHQPHPVPNPDGLPTLAELARRYEPHSEEVQRRLTGRPALDIRLAHPKDHFEQPAGGSEIAYWVRLTQPLCVDGVLHHAALAYMSDGWLNAGVASPQGIFELWQHAYVSVLNHTLWFHNPQINANEWFLFVSNGVRGHSGRGVATTHIYQRDGRLVATMAQDVLICAREPELHHSLQQSC